MRLFEKMRQGLTKTRTDLQKRIQNLVTGHKQIDEAFLDGLEETLIAVDVGVQTALALTDELRENPPEVKLDTAADVTALLKERLQAMLPAGDADLHFPAPVNVILVLGVNGTGKTTTVAKLAARFKGEGHKVGVVAADTFRAAAIEQLETWARRLDIPCIKQKTGADPSAVIFDALAYAKKRGLDLVLIDTAGRLHTVANLMEELKKIKRVIERSLPGQPGEVLLVLDATCGQNALQQARTFNQAMELSGLVLTKLDGTAKGGIGLAIMRELNIPIKFIGVGEAIDDLRLFNAGGYIDSLLGDS